MKFERGMKCRIGAKHRTDPRIIFINKAAARDLTAEIDGSVIRSILRAVGAVTGGRIVRAAENRYENNNEKSKCGKTYQNGYKNRSTLAGLSIGRICFLHNESAITMNDKDGIWF